MKRLRRASLSVTEKRTYRLLLSITVRETVITADPHATSTHFSSLSKGKNAGVQKQTYTHTQRKKKKRKKEKKKRNNSNKI